MDMDKDMDQETDNGMDKDKDTGTEMELEYFCYISICRNRPYSATWITCDTSQRKFQRHYKLVAPLPTENYDRQKYRQKFSPNDMLVEL